MQTWSSSVPTTANQSGFKIVNAALSDVVFTQLERLRIILEKQMMIPFLRLQDQTEKIFTLKRMIIETEVIG